MSLISVICEEGLVDDVAYMKTQIKILGLPFFKRIDYTSNNNVIQSLQPFKKINKIKGFRYETEN